MCGLASTGRQSLLPPRVPLSNWIMSLLPASIHNNLLESTGMKKRKLEQELLEQESKKSRSATTFVSTHTKQGGDTWKMLMDKKKKEMERKSHKPAIHQARICKAGFR